MASFYLAFAVVQYCREFAASRHSGLHTDVSHASWQIAELYLRLKQSSSYVPVDVLILYEQYTSVCYFSSCIPRVVHHIPRQVKDLFIYQHFIISVLLAS